ncbi:MAG: type I glyceraldehyde-3-phosphate dehydrogenase [Proteobacteria bacterium]|nr:type I glyceraldehyde-3-phosphate dehydrogenase [Pseudomonadota bacterium]
MSVRVGLMGFGRIGRNVFRAIYGRDDIEIVASNELADIHCMEYLLRFDSLRGSFEEPIRVLDDSLYARGRQIPVFHHKEPGQIPWFDFGVDVVVEATGEYRSRTDLQKHLDQGADRVILSTPPTDDIDHLHICGVTPDQIERSHRIISVGSSTANATALLLKVLDDAFGVEEGSFTSVHAYTSDQSLTDVPTHGDLRRSRAAMQNIVPQTTWTDEAVEKLFPHLKGKFKGIKLNVPVAEVSCSDLTVQMKRPVKASEVNEVFRSASQTILKGVLDFTDQPIVSSDMNGNPASCLFDSLATLVTDGVLLKVIGWYEQGGGISNRIVDLISQVGPQITASGDRRTS